MSKTLEYARTKPGEKPQGEGWRCFHSGCSYVEGYFWLWSRVVEEVCRDDT